MNTKKASYVTSQRQTRRHACHWPECGRQVPPAMWGCRKHWFMLPERIRAAVWKAYRPGQEQDGNPSHAYIKAAKEARTWIESQSPIGGGK